MLCILILLNNNKIPFLLRYSLILTIFNKFNKFFLFVEIHCNVIDCNKTKWSVNEICDELKIICQKTSNLMRVRKEHTKKNGTKKKESCQFAFWASIWCETGFLFSALLPNSPRPFFSSTHWQHQLGEPRAGGGIDWRSVLRARANLATGESSRYT